VPFSSYIQLLSAEFQLAAAGLRLRLAHCRKIQKNKKNWIEHAKTPVFWVAKKSITHLVFL